MDLDGQLNLLFDTISGNFHEVLSVCVTSIHCYSAIGINFLVMPKCASDQQIRLGAIMISHSRPLLLMYCTFTSPLLSLASSLLSVMP